MPIYTVTFCTMDTDTGSNPFWHTCLLLSRLDEGAKKLEVVNNWGFYGLPSTGKNTRIRKMKIRIGLDVDLYDNHGMLKSEDIGYLELGQGLHGVTFELTEAKFIELQKKCQKMVADQQEAIQEIAGFLKLKVDPAKKTRIYDYEEYSALIYQIEKTLAKSQNRPSRLANFELSPFDSANTCKWQAIKLLQGILTAKQIQRLSGGSRVVSRFSGKMETIYLHSSGPTRQRVTKKTGEKVHYRNASDAGVTLHWSLPPQEGENLAGKPFDLFQIPADYHKEVKKVIRQFQRIEWLFINASFDEKYLPLQQQLLNQIKEYYETFSITNSRRMEYSSDKTCLDRLFCRTLRPKYENEQLLIKSLDTAKQFIRNLYSAVVEDWELDIPTSSPAESKEVSEAMAPAMIEDIEALATLLPEIKKQHLCKLVKLSYFNTDTAAENAEAQETHRLAM